MRVRPRVRRRSPLGARSARAEARIVGQLFVEALVVGCHRRRSWTVRGGPRCCGGGVRLYLAQGDGLPFWIRPGLKFATVILRRAAGGRCRGDFSVVLPAIKATGSKGRAATQKPAAWAEATMRFGKVWTTAMIGQVALTVICIVPATGIAGEAVSRSPRPRAGSRPHSISPWRSQLDRDAHQRGER